MPRMTFEDDLVARGSLLFHLALRVAAMSSAQGREGAIGDISSNGSPAEADAALALAGRDLAAHPDDEVLRRAVLVLDESKQRLADSG